MKCDDCKLKLKCCSTCHLHKTDCGVLHNCGEDCPRYVPATNADHIRAMADRELAEGIINHFGARGCSAVKPTECKRREWVDGLSPCEMCLLNWLEQPYTENAKTPRANEKE